MRHFRKLKYVIAGVGAAGGIIASFVSGVYALDGSKEAAPLFVDQKQIKKWDSNWDKRDPRSLVKPVKHSDSSKNESDDNSYNEQLESKKPSATRNLILIRHGQYNLNGKKDEERYLTALGIEQANYTGKRLKELELPYTILVQSSMCRATETARIISGHLPEVPVKTCDLLREGAPCPPEPAISNWRPEYHFYTDGARIEAAFRKYFHRADPSQKEDSYEILVCHANVIRYFVCRALQLPPEAWLRMSLHNASITWLTIRPSGRVALRGLGDCGHIPREKLTTT